MCYTDLDMCFKWNYTSDIYPAGYERGDWDGKRSDLVLAIDSKNQPHIARIYEGFERGDWCDWYDKYDNELTDIVRWVEIPSV